MAAPRRRPRGLRRSGLLDPGRAAGRARHARRAVSRRQPVVVRRPAQTADHAAARARPDRAAVRAGVGHNPPRFDRDGVDVVRGAVQRRAPVRIAGSSQPRAGRLERRHRQRSLRLEQLRSRPGPGCTARSRRAVPARRRIRGRRTGPVGFVGRRCGVGRQGDRGVQPDRRRQNDRPSRHVFQRGRAAHDAPAAARASGAVPGRRIGRRARPRGPVCRRGVRGAGDARRRAAQRS